MTAKGRILVVDDDRLVLATVTHGLAQAGYEVIDADNGDDAILLAHEQRPELALLDIRMEGKSGFDVAEYLRDVCRIPFMFLSAPTASPLIKENKLRAIAVTSKVRAPSLPNVPTLEEQGIRDTEVYAWQGMVVPAATTREISSKLTAELNRAIANQEVMRKMQEFRL